MKTSLITLMALAIANTVIAAPSQVPAKREAVSESSLYSTQFQ